MPPTKVVTAHIPLSLAKKVDKLVEQLKRPRAWIVKQAVAAWVAEEEERHRMILEGLADVDAGRLIDHNKVREWAASLGTSKPKPLPKPNFVPRHETGHLLKTPANAAHLAKSIKQLQVAKAKRRKLIDA